MKIVLKHKFTECIVCPKCDCVYGPELLKIVGKSVAQMYCLKAYPNHPVKSGQGERNVECSLNEEKVASLLNLRSFLVKVWKRPCRDNFKRPGFVQCCELWCTRQNFHQFDYMCDIEDGLIWKENDFFLSAPLNYLVTLNTDWFSSFKHKCSSVGAIYLTIQNLPSSIRNRP